jgi:hypothetical protein
MTHDIDAIQKYNSRLKLPKSIIRVLLMGLGLKGVIDIVYSFIKTIIKRENDPYYVFDFLLIDDDFFEEKVVFFVAGGTSRFDLYNKNYLKNLKTVAIKATSKDYKIGFHPSYNAFNKADMFGNELKILKAATQKEILFVRTHFLRLDFNSTYEICAVNDLKIDSTLGFTDLIGFRCGTGFKYFLYDFENEKQSLIQELPLIVMDSSLLYMYCKNNSSCFRKILFDFVDSNRFNTHITFNFHNSTFDRSLKNRSDMINTYSELITNINNFYLKINSSSLKIN